MNKYLLIILHSIACAGGIVAAIMIVVSWYNKDYKVTIYTNLFHEGLIEAIIAGAFILLFPYYFVVMANMISKYEKSYK